MGRGSNATTRAGHRPPSMPGSRHIWTLRRAVPLVGSTWSGGLRLPRGRGRRIPLLPLNTRILAFCVSRQSAHNTVEGGAGTTMASSPPPSMGLRAVEGCAEGMTGGDGVMAGSACLVAVEGRAEGCGRRRLCHGGVSGPGRPRAVPRGCGRRRRCRGGVSGTGRRRGPCPGGCGRKRRCRDLGASRWRVFRRPRGCGRPYR